MTFLPVSWLLILHNNKTIWIKIRSVVLTEFNLAGVITIPCNMGGVSNHSQIRRHTDVIFMSYIYSIAGLATTSHKLVASQLTRSVTSPSSCKVGIQKYVKYKITLETMTLCVNTDNKSS